LGRGVWGQALSSVLKANKVDHLLWDRTSEVDSKSIVVIALPTQAIREVLTNNKENLKNSIIINTSKGIEKGTHMLPHEIAKEVLGDKIKYLSMSGPSFAVEVVSELSASAPVSVSDADKKKIVQRMSRPSSGLSNAQKSDIISQLQVP
jgi:glycerol-3-phosphate dehydrogenase (NAD(P)+)